MLQTVERLTSEAADITTSVRDLPTVRTPLGRARAWLRLALMQKKLPDYVRLLLENQQVSRHVRGSRKWIPGSDPKDLDPGSVRIIDPTLTVCDRSTGIIDPPSQ